VRTSIKLWTSAIAALVVALPSSANASEIVASTAISTTSQSGEGGEGGESGSHPSSYRLMLNADAAVNYSAKAVQARYVELAFENYQQAQNAAEALDNAIQSLTSKPSEQRLSDARTAWRQARMAYLPTEIYRYFDSPIDNSHGPESRINAWPVNEAVMEDTNQKTGARADLIGALSQPLTQESIRARDQAADEADVTTGFHAIEFLLWGTDTNAAGPGSRKSQDFLSADAKTGDAIKIRRSQYLRILSQLLRADLQSVAQAWNVNNQASYGHAFIQYDQFEALGRMLRGMASLSAEELASERLTVALDSGTQEDETSCFSDQTHLEFADGVRGIRAVWLGVSARALLANSASRVHPDSLAALITKLDPAAADAVNAALRDAEKAAARIDAPFDQTLLKAPDSPERLRAEALSTALQNVARVLQKSGRSAGVLVSVPGV